MCTFTRPLVFAFTVITATGHRLGQSLSQQPWTRLAYLTIIFLCSLGGIFTASFSAHAQTPPTFVAQYWLDPLGPDLVADLAGNIFISNGSTIRKFSQSGQLLSEWGSEISPDGKFNPGKIAVDSSGNLYVADNANFRVLKFTETGSFLLQWGSRGSGNNQFLELTGLAVDRKGNVYTGDAVNRRIQRFNASGSFIRTWTCCSNSLYQSMIDITVDPKGDIYALFQKKGFPEGDIPDYFRPGIERFSPDGDLITRWNTYSAAINGKQHIPWGIASDAFGDIWVVDSASSQALKFSPVGELITVMLVPEYLYDAATYWDGTIFFTSKLDHVVKVYRDQLPIDNRPPITRLETTPSKPNGPNGWYLGHQVNLKFLATDDGVSGVKEIVYRVGTNSPTIVAGPAVSVTVNTRGTSTITYFARDNAGNQEAPRQVTIKLD